MDLAGTSAVVVGAAGGLGRATVGTLAAAGMHVTAADLDRQAAEAALSGVADVDVRVASVMDEGELATAMGAAAVRGPLRVVVICHGGPAQGGRLVRRDGSVHSIEAFQRTVDLFLVGTFNAMRLGAAAMASTTPDPDGHRGVIVTTSSIAAFEGGVGQLPYAAAKAGVAAMTLVAARDLAPTGVRVMSIAPGVMATPAFRRPLDEVEETFGRRVLFPQRLGRPQEYASLVETICRNDYLNGEVIRLDGGLRLSARLSDGE